MILDIENEKNSKFVRISYMKQGSREILTIPKSDFWYWEYAKKTDKADQKFKSWDNKDVIKRLYKDTSTINKHSIIEWINSQEDELKSALYNFEMPKLLFCDIETDIIDGFPDVKKAKEKITCITCCWIEKNIINIIVLGEKQNFNYETVNMMNNFINTHISECTDMKTIMKYIYEPDEVKLLEKFISICSKFHVITGWHFGNSPKGDGFDWPFLTNRMKRLGVDFSRISPTGSVINSIPSHFPVVDYMYVFDRFDYSIKVKESISLDFVSGEILGVKKLDYPGTLVDMYNNDYYRYVLYNAIDTILVALIDYKCKTLSSLLALGANSLTHISKCDSPINVTENLLLNGFLKRDRVLPNKYDPKEKLDYEGAYVKEPLVGMYELIACFDFSSLYPSIARSLNLSFENFKRKTTPDLIEYDKYLEYQDKINRGNKNEIVSFTGCVFENDKTSVLKELFDGLYADRKSAQYRAKLCAEISNKLKNRKR